MRRLVITFGSPNVTNKKAPFEIIKENDGLYFPISGSLLFCPLQARAFTVSISSKAELVKVGAALFPIAGSVR